MDKVLVKDLSRGVVPRPQLSFVEFCEKHSQRIADVSAKTATSIPKEMYTNDNRMDLGKFTSHAMGTNFNELTERLSIGHDLIYLDDDRVSLKFNKVVKGGNFQSRGYKPKDIIIKSPMSNSGKTYVDGDDLKFDYLWVINYEIYDGPQERAFSNDNVVIEFGIATKETVLKRIVESSIDKPILRAKLWRDDWSYYSGPKFAFVKLNSKLRSSIYISQQNKLWNALLNA